MLGVEMEGDGGRHLEEGDRLAAIGPQNLVDRAISVASSASSPPPFRPSRIRSLKRTRCGEV